MSKLDDFILVQEKRHSYTVSEIQKGEQRIIDEIKDAFEPRVRSLENSRTNFTGVLTGLSLAWAAIVGAIALAFQHKDKFPGGN